MKKPIKNYKLRIKNYGIFLILILNFQFSIFNCLYSAFENPSSGARPYGMGNAFCGLADDIQAIFYNPAGITQV